MRGVDYIPPPMCAQLIASEHPYSFIIGPVGSGKTTAILFKILYHAQRQRPSPTDGIRYTRFAVVRNTNRMLQDTTLKSFFQWFPPTTAGTWQATPKTFTFRYADVHCEIIFRPLDTADDVSNVLSLELTGAVLDEFVEIPREIVDALQSRCGRFPNKELGGCTWSGMWGASNPGMEDDWWYDWLYGEWAKEDGGALAKAGTLAFFEQPSGFSVAAENLGNLPPYKDASIEYYEKLAVGKKDSWVRQFIEVQWGFSQRGKPVYPTFNREMHCARRDLIFNPEIPLVMGFDAGLTPAAVFGQQDMYGRVLVLRELVSEGMGAKRFCREKVIPMLNREFPGADLVVMADPATKQRAQTDEATVASVLERELNVRVIPAPSNALSARLEAVEEYLQMLTEAGPAMLVDKSCKTLLRGYVGGYRFELVGRTGEKKPHPDKNFYSHVHDANQYLCQYFSSGRVRKMAASKAPVLPVGYRNTYVY